MIQVLCHFFGKQAEENMNRSKHIVGNICTNVHAKIVGIFYALF